MRGKRFQEEESDSSPKIKQISTVSNTFCRREAAASFTVEQSAAYVLEKSISYASIKQEKLLIQAWGAILKRLVVSTNKKYSVYCLRGIKKPENVQFWEAKIK